MKKIRLDKFLSDNTKYTRNEIKKQIKAGSVTVDGDTVTKNDFSFIPDKAAVTLNGENIAYKKFVYLILNKPSGVLSASSDKNRKTVVDLLDDNYQHYSLFPVGRLDKDTTGLLLLTNDGDFAHKIISPKYNIEKSYIASVDGAINPDIIEKFKKGIILADGTICKSAVLEICGENTVRIVLTEGKYHQIKRMLGVVGLGVVGLHRERIGGLTLPKSLELGDFCEISINDLFTYFPEIFSE